jgi:hypothetical protein
MPVMVEAWRARVWRARARGRRAVRERLIVERLREREGKLKGRTISKK